MQKKLLTMAVAGALAAPVAALAQVTVYGSIDTGIRNQSKVITATGDDSVLLVQSQGKKTNRWGLKGSDDLGGGLMASFNLEGGYDSDTGAGLLTTSGGGLFGRYAVVGLSKGGNKIDLGKDYTLNFRTHGIYDPLSHDYGTAAPVSSVATAGVRTANSIMAAFRFGAGGVAVQYGAGETPGDNGAGTYTAFNGDMTFGPATIGAAFGSREDATGGTSTDTTNLGGAYKMGAFTFRAGITMEDDEGAGTESQKLSGGVQYDFSPTLTGRVSLYDLSVDDNAGTEVGSNRTLVLNVEYSLSKRTLVYAAFDRKTLEGTQLGTAVGDLNDGATGIMAGIVHNF
jgi:predicted porin